MDKKTSENFSTNALSLNKRSIFFNEITRLKSSIYSYPEYRQSITPDKKSNINVKTG